MRTERASLQERGRFKGPNERRGILRYDDGGDKARLEVVVPRDLENEMLTKAFLSRRKKGQSGADS